MITRLCARRLPGLPNYFIRQCFLMWATEPSEAYEEVVADLVDQWQQGAGGSMTLYEWLGWSEEEFERWADSGRLP